MPTCAPCRLGPIDEDRAAGLALPLEVSQWDTQMLQIPRVKSKNSHISL